jgi:hypothetical protein
VFVVLLLRPYDLAFSVNAPATYRALWDQGILEQPLVDLALADAGTHEGGQTAGVAARSGSLRARSGDHWSCRRGCASLIDMADRPLGSPSSLAKPGNAPAPGSVPKLPKTIFNLEKKGGSGSSGPARRTEHK